MAKRIFFDGLNLGLRHGTGVATYTRVLVRLCKELGYENGVLHSTRRRLPRDPMAREIAFFDAQPETEPPFALRALVGVGDYLSGLAGVRPQQVPLTGTVITEALGNRWTPTDHVYAAPRVFDQSRG